MKNAVNLSWWQYAVLFIAVLVVGGGSISSHSLWMDEGLRIGYSNIKVEDGYFESSFQSMHVGLVHYMYAWGQLIGTTEVAYRAMNLPFLLVAAVYMGMMLRRLNLSAWWVLVFVAHPLTVYYMNDAGPYIALLGCACAVTYHCFFARCLNCAWNTAASFAWLLLGFAMHFTFGFVGFLYLYALAYRLWKCKQMSILWKDAAVAVPYLPAFGYIAWMYFTHMPDGSALGMDTPGLFNIGTVGYCFAGFAGLGAPRNEMKALGMQAFSPVMMGLVMAHLVALLLLLCLNIRRLLPILKKPAILATAVVALLFFAGAVAKDFNFWERHVIFLFPAFFLLLAVLLQASCTHGKRVLNLILVSVCVLMLLTSSARLRWDEPYRKDDYKCMIHHLRHEGLLNGRMPVLAQGDFFLFNYYGVGFAEGYFVMQPNCVSGVMHVPQDTLVRMVEHLCNRYPAVCLILHEKKTLTPQLYGVAESFFENLGYEVECNKEFNTFKILILKRRFVL